MLNPIKRTWNSKGAGITAGIVLVLVLLVVIVAIVLSFVAPADPESSPSKGGTAAQAPIRETTKTGGKCGVPAGDTSLRPAAPKDLSWASLNGLTWPVSRTVGPTKTQDQYPVCFARSPLGAALSGTNFLYQAWAGNLRSAADFYVIESPGKTTLKNTSQTDNAKKLAEAGWTAAGFIVESFTRDEAQINVVFSTPGSQTGYTGFPLTLAWQNDDWRLEVLDSGNLWTGSPSTPVKGQFVEWSK